MKIIGLFLALICLADAIHSSIQIDSLLFPNGDFQAPAAGGFSCSEALDIVLVLDGSGSVHPSEWANTITFALNFASSIANNSNIRIGGVTFGNNATRVYSVGNGIPSTFKSYINQTLQPKGLTNTAQGISTAYDDLRTFGRPGIPGLIFVVLNSNSNYGEDPVITAAIAKNANYFIYAIGATKNINYSQVNLIASTPTSRYVFQQSYAGIIDSNFTNTIVSKSICYQKCYGKNYIEIVLDGSSSLDANEWNITRQWILNFIFQFNMSSNGTYIGLTQFGSQTTTPLTMTYRYADALTILKNLAQVGGTTPIADGLTKGFADITNYVPTGSNATLLLVTNGNANQGDDPVPVAKMIKSRGVRIVVLSIGEVNQGLIAPIASEPLSDNLFYQPNFTTVFGAIQPVSTSICGVAVCNKGVNVDLLLDGSSSIVPASWNLMKSFSAKLVESFLPANSASRVGIVQFSDAAKVWVALTNNKQNILSTLSTMAQSMGNTYLGNGIQTTQKDIDTNRNSAFPSKMIIMTDGASTDSPIDAATRAKNAGTEIFCIGIGDSVVVNQLNQVASSPPEKHVFLAKSFDDLAGMVSQIVSGAC